MKFNLWNCFNKQKFKYDVIELNLFGHLANMRICYYLYNINNQILNFIKI